MITRIFRRRIDWQGITVEIAYEPHWLGDVQNPVAHLQISSIGPHRSPLPITETGYRSHFVAAGDIASLDEAVAFVQSWLDEASRTRAWRDRQDAARQLALF